MRRMLVVAAVAAQLICVGVRASEPEQPIVPLPQAEQRVEWLPPEGTQTVEAVDAGGVQTVGKAEIPTETQRTVSKAGKVAVAILGGALGLASAAAMLIFI